MKNLLSIFFIICSVSLLTFSCFEDEDEPVVLCDFDGIQSTGTAYSNAVLAYSQNPTYANCNKIKTTGQTYVNKLKSCPETNSADLSAVEDMLDDLDCTIHL